MRRAGAVPVALAVAAFLAHLAVVAWGPYGPHRDALLYYAMGEHMRLLAMDFPPFIALVARFFTAFGKVELLTHLPTAGAHAALIVLAAAFARRAGGGGASQVLAALTIATAPVFMRAGSLFQPVVFDQLWWTAALLVLSAMRPVVEPRRWLILGMFLGLGLLTKFTVLVLGAGILVAVLATPLRRHLLTPWPWLAALVALLIGSPSLVGQLVLGWPFFGQLADLEATQLERVTPTTFVLEQLLMVGPILIAAAAATLFPRRGLDRDTRLGLSAVGWAAGASFALMLLASGKPYYIAPIWPAVIGIGLGRIDAALQLRRESGDSGRWQRRLALGVLTLLVVSYGLVTLPLGLPFLAPEPMSRYAARMGMAEATTTNRGAVIALPQDYADMLGWESLSDAVVSAWNGLSTDDRARAAILATNYGRAGAIDWFAPDALPDVLAPVGSYWFWGPGDRRGDVAIIVGSDAQELSAYWRSVVEVARVRRTWGVPEEQDVGIFIGRDPVRTLQDVWPEFRGRN